jgi:signal transduction histidine kinase
VTRSIRARLLLWVLVVVVPLTTAAGWLLTEMFAQRLTRDIDVALQEEAETIGEVMATPPSPAALQELLQHVSGANEFGARKYVVVRRDGQVLAASPASAPEVLSAASRGLRVIRYNPSLPGVTVAIGVYDGGAVRATQRLRSLVAVGVPVLILLVGAGWWLVVGRELRPLERAAQQLDRIEAEDLSVRLPEARRDDEVGRVARGVNGMLDRLDRAVGELRRFTADAAHALRTPLTVLRAGLEVALAREREPAEYRATLTEALASTEYMSRIAERLLTLARLEAAETPRARLSVDVGEMVRELADAFRSRVRQNGGVLEVEIPADLRVSGDAGDLYRLFYDLLDNAVRYGRTPGGARTPQVRVSATASATEVRITVADSGPGVLSADLPHIFDRFYRGQAQRSDDGGSGLGLSIAQQIVRAHGGAIEIANAETGGCVVAVRVPRDKPAELP